MNRRDQAIRSFVRTALALLGVLFLLGRCVACFEQPKQLAAAAGYEAQQMRCVEQYADRASIDKCRAKVKLDWTLDKFLDAGSEGGDR